ncbi:hypothetical protein [Citromicrobium bathyomarinum]|uniref:hypothetical protein n=1 Tax=Citromicrobium bathyomarinum TaxID=72174 RepID=UPI00315ADB7F
MRKILNVLAAGALVAAPVVASAQNTRAGDSVPASLAKVDGVKSVLTERSSKPVRKGEGSSAVGPLLPLYIIGGIIGGGVILEVTGVIDIFEDKDEPISPGT